MGRLAELGSAGPHGRGDEPLLVSPRKLKTWPQRNTIQLLRSLLPGDLADQRLPLRDLLLDLGSILRRSRLDGAGAGLAHGFFHFRIVGHLDQDIRQLAYDRFWRLGRSHDPVPRLRDKIGNGRLVHRRQIREIGAALKRRNGEASYRAGLDLRQCFSDIGESEVDFARDYRCGRLRAAPERDVHCTGAGADEKQLDGVMRQTTDAA